jgi:hypothetical protein
MEEAAQSHVYRGPEVEPCALHRPSASYVYGSHATLGALVLLVVRTWGIGGLD